MCQVDLPEQLITVLAGIEDQLLEELRGHGGRFSNLRVLEARVRNGVRAVREQGRGRYPDLVTRHNELCVALELLRIAGGSRVEQLSYETPAGASDNRIDFRADLADGRRSWLEVKTIQPISQDDWDRYMEFRAKGRFPENVEVIYSGNIAGEIFHGSYASRSKMLEYTIETEQRVDSLGIDPTIEACFLVFCGSGFDWTKDELEDFAGYYLTGRHRQDDAYREMEEHHIEQRKIELSRAISHFGFMKRPSISIRPTEVVWSVQPPLEFS